MILIIIKLVISIIMVLGLIYISEKNPRLGGLCSGLPLSVGIFTYFYAKENGLHFLMISMPYAMAGFANALIYTIGFYLGSKLFTEQRYLNTISAVVLGAIVYFISGYFVTLLNLNILSGFVIFMLSMIVSIIFFSQVPKTTNISKKNISKPLNKIMVILFRIVFVSILVLLITGVSKSVGHQWAGIFSSFPVMLASVCTAMVLKFTQMYLNTSHMECLF